MIDQLYLALNDIPDDIIEERRLIQESEQGMMHSKQAFRYEIVKTLPQEAVSVDELFDYARAFGDLRVGWINSEGAGGSETTGTAIGGVFGFDTATLDHFRLHVAATTSQKVPVLNPTSRAQQSIDFFDAQGESFTYLSEVSIDYVTEAFSVRAGRIRVDTPFADSDDIRMAANTFEGVTWDASLSDTLQFSMLYMNSWAGYDSGEDQDRFKPLVIDAKGDKGWGGIGMGTTYTLQADDELTLWAYHFDKMGAMLYAEVAGHFALGDASHLEYGLQAASMVEAEHSGVEGQVLGMMALYDLEFLFVGMAGNYAFVGDEKVISDGFGGGPYYTSLDESTIGFVSELAPGSDIYSTRFGIGGNLDALGFTGLTLEVVHGQIKSTDATEWLKENDVAITYTFGERVSLEGVFANYYVEKTKIDDEHQHFDRYVIRADYSF